MAKLPPKGVLLSNKWTAFYSAEPDTQFRASLTVSFPTPDSMRFTKRVLFSELGLGDDVELTIDSPVTVSDVWFTVPATITKTGTNPQGHTAGFQLTGTNYGFSLEWGSHRMFMMGRAFEIMATDDEDEQ